MELTKEQERVLNKAKKHIDIARQFNDFESYWIATHDDAHPVPDEEEGYSFFKKWWKDNCNGIDLVRASTSTIKALEKKGFIEIIKVGGSFPDSIKVLNY